MLVAAGSLLSGMLISADALKSLRHESHMDFEVGKSGLMPVAPHRELLCSVLVQNTDTFRLL